MTTREYTHAQRSRHGSEGRSVSGIGRVIGRGIGRVSVSVIVSGIGRGIDGGGGGDWPQEAAAVCAVSIADHRAGRSSGVAGGRVPQHGDV